MRECMICGARRHVQSCEKVQLCTRCAKVLWEVLQPKLHPEQVQTAEQVKNKLPVPFCVPDADCGTKASLV